MEHTDQFNMIRNEWRKFINGECPENISMVSDTILESWIRCRGLGVNPYIKKIPVVLFDKELEDLLNKNKKLIEICRPFMMHLHSFVKGSGFIVVLSDANSYLLDRVGDADVLEVVKKGNFIEGSCWSEEVGGTNGVGTAIVAKRPLQVCASEHYCINSQLWTCSGAPIHDPEGKISALIAMTGPYQKAHPHTLGIVTAAAIAIENEMRLKKALTECQTAENFQRTVISSIREIIMTIDNNGCISMMNKNAKNAFGPETDKFLGKNIKDLWSKQNDNLLNLIKNNDSLTDVEVNISHKNVHSDYTLTCYPILSMNDIAGKVIILNEIKRARTLAASMLGAKAKFSFEDIIGLNHEFLETLRQAKLASQNKSNVLLLGDSGTGKDIFAQAIHNNSSRRNGPYLAINCAAIPRDLITSELFGYSDGAFSGSRKGGNQGKFELTDGGTIFLDEIGEMPLELQAALLRVIEDKSIMRIGGTKVTTVDVRIIAATHKNLKDEVKKGKFREDLYYRLNVFTISMIPLRQRKEDIPILAYNFINKIGRAMGKEIEKVDNEVLDKLLSYHWPGNVRELQNVLERMINITHTNMLTVDLLPSEITNSKLMKFSYEIESFDKIERKLITTMLRSNLPKGKIAGKLGISRSTLYRKLDKYELNNTNR
jgi:transcriptional regulator of acetoin/glycerol metabolism